MYLQQLYAQICISDAGKTVNACESDILRNGRSKVESCVAVPFLCASKYLCLYSVYVGFVLVSKYAVEKIAGMLSQCIRENTRTSWLQQAIQLK